MSTFTLVSAQATAAKNIITLLTEASLLGQHKHTKLNEAREAITVVLSKCSTELSRMEKVTGKNLWYVYMAMTEMRGRARWADHDNMMNTVEATLKGFITEYTNEADATTEVTDTEVATEVATTTTEATTTVVKGNLIALALTLGSAIGLAYCPDAEAYTAEDDLATIAGLMCTSVRNQTPLGETDWAGKALVKLMANSRHYRIDDPVWPALLKEAVYEAQAFKALPCDDIGSAIGNAFAR